MERHAELSSRAEEMNSEMRAVGGDPYAHDMVQERLRHESEVQHHLSTQDRLRAERQALLEILQQERGSEQWHQQESHAAQEAWHQRLSSADRTTLPLAPADSRSSVQLPPSDLNEMLHEPDWLVRAPGMPVLPPREDLRNHQRLLRVLREGKGLLHSDEDVDVYCTVVPPSAVPTATAHDARPWSGLVAELALRVQARAQPQTRQVRQETTGAYANEGGGGGATRGLTNLHLHVVDVDVAAMDFHILPATAATRRPHVPPSAPPHAMKQQIQFELIEVLCAHPKLEVEAEVVDVVPDLYNGDKPRKHEEYRGCFVLPIGITTFLQQLPVGVSFQEVWERLAQTAHGSLKKVAPWAAGPARGYRSALTCGECMRFFELNANKFGLGAELPEHGCVAETLPVLVLCRVKPSGGECELEARSPERRLASAVLAAVEEQLLLPDMPQHPGYPGGGYTMGSPDERRS